MCMQMLHPPYTGKNAKKTVFMIRLYERGHMALSYTYAHAHAHTHAHTPCWRPYFYNIRSIEENIQTESDNKLLFRRRIKPKRKLTRF